MQPINKYDIVFSIDSGIGNALEAMYAIEYCLEMGVKAGIYLNKISASFQEYLRKCYGSEVILASTNGITTKNFVYSFTCHRKTDIIFDHFFYVDSNLFSSKYQSETEMSMSIVKSLYPGNYYSPVLKRLIGENTDNVKKLNVNQKTVLYSGSTSPNAFKRWHRFPELEKTFGTENVIFIGGKEDIDYSMSYIYPSFIVKLFPQPLLNRKSFWQLVKKIGLLKTYSHIKYEENKPNIFINYFKWEELVEIFRHCKQFIGNDGGLSHLAAAAGANGVVIFGATSVEKNKAYNPKMKPLSKNFPCQPCQFGVGGVLMGKYFINCPYQVRCLTSISVQDVINKLKEH